MRRIFDSTGEVTSKTTRQKRSRRPKGLPVSVAFRSKSGKFAATETGSKAAESHTQLCKPIQNQNATAAKQADRIEGPMLDGMKPGDAKGGVHGLARPINAEMQKALRAVGVDEANQAEALKKLRVSKSERIRLDAIKEINRILDAYPAPKTDVEPMTFQLVIDMKV
jgi:hypothetical protein